MKLQDFIDFKVIALRNSNLYREVNFASATDVKLSKNSVTENFISVNSDREKEVTDTLSNEELDGSKISFHVVKKGKRKTETLNFHVLFI